MHKQRFFLLKDFLNKILCPVLFILFSYQVNAQLTVNNTLTPFQLVQNVLLGTGVTVMNVQYTGSSQAIGSFDGTASNIGLNSGIILASGRIIDAPGPNGSPDAGLDLLKPGDANLTALAGANTQDAAILQFDFVPASDSISFDYVFGSEEYPEFVCSNYNDVFAFFLTGPNPGGGSYSNQNIALIPGTSMAVAINSVNNGSVGLYGTVGGCTSLAYSAYYIDNTGGATVQYDAFTTILRAMALVVPCDTYHIKIAIADAGDGEYDSGVFLRAKSFSSPVVNISAIASTNDSVMVEGCGAGTFIFTRGGDLSQVFTIKYLISGTALNGIDYQNLSGGTITDSIVFAIGQDTALLQINPVNDGISEPTETIIIAIPTLTSCITDTLKATIYIKNVDPLNVTTSGDTTICPQSGGKAIVTASFTGGYGPFTFQWDNSLGTDPTIEVNPPVTTTYSIVVHDSCGNESASNSVTVDILCPIEIPNVLTPNGDGFNDHFIIRNIDEYPNSKLIVFSRWGNKVFESSSYNNEWDGGSCSDGVYFYILNQSNGDIYHGTITLLR